jgi:hypothetical protein
MPGVNVKIIEDTATPGFKKAAKAVPKGSQSALVLIGLEIQNTARESMSRGSPSGRFYKRGARVHQASAPGEPPAVDRGRLVGSVISRPGKGFVEVGTHLGYGEFWENARINIRRPWLAPAVEKHLDKIEGTFKVEIERRS